MLLIASLIASREVLWPLIRCVETREWDLLVCPDSETAFSRLQREPPNVIVVDDRLAGSDAGRTLLRQLQTCPALRGVPILVVCDADDLESDKSEFSQHGFSSCCDASDWEDLTRAVEEAASARKWNEVGGVLVTV